MEVARSRTAVSAWPMKLRDKMARGIVIRVSLLTGRMRQLTSGVCAPRKLCKERERVHLRCCFNRDIITIELWRIRRSTVVIRSISKTDLQGLRRRRRSEKGRSAIVIAAMDRQTIRIHRCTFDFMRGSSAVPSIFLLSKTSFTNTSTESSNTQRETNVTTQGL